MKFLNSEGVSYFWSRVKELLLYSMKSNVTDKLGKANGIATLDGDGKLPEEQLTELKTINGTSVVGHGDITIDLSLYRIVAELPTENIEENKIYLVLSNKGEEENVYTEYVYDGKKWEKLGDFRTSVDLEPYLKTDNLDTETRKLGYVKFTDEATEDKTGVMNNFEKRWFNLFRANGVISNTFTKYTEDAVQIVKSVFKGIDEPKLVEEEVGIKAATQTEAGVMTAVDKKRLDEMADNSTHDEAIPVDELQQLLQSNA